MCTYVRTRMLIYSKHSVRERVCSLACVYAVVQDIFALARSSAATTKNIPILRLCSPLASTLNPTRVRLLFPVIRVLLDRTEWFNLLVLLQTYVRCLVESNIPGKWSLFDRFRCQLFPCLTANYVFFILVFFRASSLQGICGPFFVRTFRTDLLTLINRSWKRRVELFVRLFFVHSEERYS